MVRCTVAERLPRCSRPANLEIKREAGIEQR